ncbi:MAG: hypothetical protein HC773_19295 [Scytonema sp. CRU_2_7]|nr:hypothetical protein [Scytonema sp. CRU_2_7]
MKEFNNFVSWYSRFTSNVSAGIGVAIAIFDFDLQSELVMTPYLVKLPLFLGYHSQVVLGVSRDFAAVTVSENPLRSQVTLH